MDVPPRHSRANDEAFTRPRAPRRGSGQAPLTAAPRSGLPPHRGQSSDHAPPDVAHYVGANAAPDAVQGAARQKAVHDEGRGGGATARVANAVPAPSAVAVSDHCAAGAPPKRAIVASSAAAAAARTRADADPAFIAARAIATAATSSP